MIETDIEWLTIVANRLHKRLPRRRVDRHELLSDGYLAVVKLRHQYDARMGVPFRGFALKRVVGAMIDGLRSRQSREIQTHRCDRHIQPAEDVAWDVPLHHLLRRDRLVMHLHYREELTLREVAKIFGCSQARISQMHQRALCKLRE